MSIQEYKYVKCTHKQVVDCIKWCQNIFNMRDWEIEVDTYKDPPSIFKEDNTEGDIARTNVRKDYLKATIWIPIDIHKTKNANVLQSVIHEFVHIVTLGMTSIDVDDSETLSYRLEAPLYRLYCYENKVKLIV